MHWHSYSKLQIHYEIWNSLTTMHQPEILMTYETCWGSFYMMLWVTHCPLPSMHALHHLRSWEWAIIYKPFRTVFTFRNQVTVSTLTFFSTYKFHNVLNRMKRISDCFRTQHTLQSLGYLEVGLISLMFDYHVTTDLPRGSVTLCFWAIADWPGPLG